MNMAAAGAGQELPSGTVFGLGGVSHQDVDAQPVAVLHEHVAAVGQFGRLPVALPHQARVGVRGAFMGGVGAAFPFEIDHPGAVATVLGRLAILALETLEGGPGLDQRAIDGEVVRGQQMLSPSEIDHFVEKSVGRDRFQPAAGAGG
jgi:hypothetical protein